MRDGFQPDACGLTQEAWELNPPKGGSGACAPARKKIVRAEVIEVRKSGSSLSFSEYDGEFSGFASFLVKFRNPRGACGEITIPAQHPICPIPVGATVTIEWPVPDETQDLFEYALGEL